MANIEQTFARFLFSEGRRTVNNCSKKTLTLTKPVKVITHIHPDTDAWACAWLLRDYYPEEVSVELGFVPAGTRLPEDDPDWEEYKIIHVDTGGGKFDQHGKELDHSSSFELLANGLGYRGDVAVEKLIVMTNNADNARTMDPTSIHYLISALHFSCKASAWKYEKEVDWAMVLDRVFFILDTMASKWRADAAVALKFDNSENIETLANGLRFCALTASPGLRHEAYQRGADVVVWVAPAKGGFYPAVQVNENCKADLTPLIALLRSEEARCRGVDTSKLNLEQFRSVKGIPGWFLHDSRRFLGSGTKSHPLTGDDLTKMKAAAFKNVARNALSEIEFGSRT